MQGSNTQRKLTIQDIARLAGVSKATVSRVLNHRPSVNPSLRERVLRTIHEYGFIPNATATGLASGHTRLLGVLAPPLTWPAIPEIMRGVAEYIEGSPYEIVLYSISFERNHSDVLDRILSMSMVSGLLAILPGGLGRYLYQRFHLGLPLVVIDDQKVPAQVPRVGIDNVNSAYTATRYLLELGHRRIAHIQGPLHYLCSQERYQGYCRALEEAGITPDPNLLLQGSFEVESGQRCAETLFSRPRNAWPTAIFSANDQMAYGVMDVAERLGVRIPEDVSLVGFDDNMLSSHLRPPLTTVHQPFSDMGFKAVELLLNMLDSQHSKQQEECSIHLQLPTQLCIRKSSGPPYYLLS
ncbi:LacI family transcriptional regulator [Thermosporothrix hazakensis]|jgi:LacI family transcriptional regulator|uniref:LacI family transcriptional regulator n=1 Tax=Thermosporothrix hazakensis TaxID=644383 RepID=A0A326UAN0_THEHA|nr:LacI family DNA-binding transcriptional regulator [Thermosporothrix hazakensis]PZW32718.1 LacI family transcriptional regulator [Thermosporothrix hazakensis]GCE50074.1 LacI family transcriptional regulator [Thermosporothrix hazakensis]